VHSKILRPLLQWEDTLWLALHSTSKDSVCHDTDSSAICYSSTWILHMAAFMTLCEAYMGIEPHFNLWNYFFHARLQQGSDAETTAFGNVDIFV
jgi:hypothetical protein